MDAAALEKFNPFNPSTPSPMARPGGPGGNRMEQLFKALEAKANK
jgi:hypothetical protein